MRHLLYIAAFHLCFVALAEKPRIGGGAASDHFVNDEARAGGAGGEDPQGEGEVKPRRIFDSFGDSLRAAEDRHQAQVEAVLSGRARAERGTAQTSIFKSLPASQGLPAARAQRRPDPTTESPKNPSANPFK